MAAPGAARSRKSIKGKPFSMSMRRFFVLVVTVFAAVALAASPAMPASSAAKKDTRSKACKKAKTKKQKAKACKKDTRSKACKKAKTKKQKAKACKKAKKPKPGKPGTPLPPKLKSLAPFDYLLNKGLSEKKYDDKDIERSSLMLPMGDGVQLYIEVIKPKGATNLR